MSREKSVAGHVAPELPRASGNTAHFPTITQETTQWRLRPHTEAAPEVAQLAATPPAGPLRGTESYPERGALWADTGHPIPLSLGQAK